MLSNADLRNPSRLAVDVKGSVHVTGDGRNRVSGTVHLHDDLDFRVLKLAAK